MRPRNLIKFFIHSRGYAINLGHDRIEVEDFKKGEAVYSNDVLLEAGQELADIYPGATDLLYRFIGEGPDIGYDVLVKRLQEHGIEQVSRDKVIDFLLYFGFFGARTLNEEPFYIYDEGYNFKLLKARIGKAGQAVSYHLNPAFWAALGVKEYAR